MNISILSVFPELYTTFLNTSLLKRAQETKLINVTVDSFFSFVPPKTRIDAPTYGPGAGMLIRPEVVQDAVESIEERRKARAFKIFFSPQGRTLTQPVLRELAERLKGHEHIMLVAGRYEGMDARVEEVYADELFSVGDFVLMGGDIPAMLFLESFLRLIPGVVGKQESVQEESFSGPFVDYPEYTEPLEWQGKHVPALIRSGNHAAIKKWRFTQAARNTIRNHFGWYRTYTPLSLEDRKIAQKLIPPHYVALMHGEVLVGKGANRQPGVTSVTSIDIHDIARSSCTYGLEEFFIVTPLLDQERIVTKLLDFWNTEVGISYNQNRHEAVSRVSVKNVLNDCILAIEAKHGVKPLVIATSARSELHAKRITYHDQHVVWNHERPVLFLLGTGQGLQPEVIERCDYLLVPLEGLSQFNHLSVRSAAAIIFDRWLGLQPKYVSLPLAGR